MGATTSQFVLAVLGIAGTLAGSLMTQILQRRAEADRQRSEDVRRWHADRFRACKELLYKVTEVQRVLWSACAMLPGESERAALRQVGRTTLLNVREEDVPAPTDDYSIFDSISLTIVREALEQATSLLEEAEHLTVELALLSEGVVNEAAQEMFEAAWDAAGTMESTQRSSDEAARSVLDIAEPKAAFERAVRVELGVSATIQRRPGDSAPVSTSRPPSVTSP